MQHFHKTQTWQSIFIMAMVSDSLSVELEGTTAGSISDISGLVVCK